LKILLMGDTHAGCRNDNVAFYEYQKKFYDNVLFPFIDKFHIQHVIHLGDLVDNRRQLNIQTAKRLREDFLEPMAFRSQFRGLDFHIILGNHDTYFKNTNVVNSLSEILNPEYGFHVYTQPTNVVIEGTEFLMLPWMAPANRASDLEDIKNSTAKYCMAHLELKGFEQTKGILARHGDDKDIFAQFKSVFSGHYHIRSNSDNINYIGSCFQFNWGDYNDYRGFCILDISDGKASVAYYKNPYDMFVKLTYEEDVPCEIGRARDAYCRVEVLDKRSESKYNDFINSIHELGVVDLMVDEKAKPVVNLETGDIDVGESNTFIIIKQAISSLDYDDKDGLEFFFEDIHREALEVS